LSAAGQILDWENCIEEKEKSTAMEAEFLKRALFYGFPGAGTTLLLLVKKGAQ
jgi:hypothetical protein